MDTLRSTSSAQCRRGLAYALVAYSLWGLLPVYFRALHAVDPLEIACHRVVWSVVLLLGLLALKGELRASLRLMKDRRTRRALVVSTLLICGNSLLFIYAISTGRAIEASFGYFINPLLTVALGVMIFRERLNGPLLGSLALATAGVAVRLWTLGTIPWIALGLAMTFGLYGLVRKQAGIPPVPGLAMETLLAMPAAIFGLGWFAARGQLAFTSLGLTTDTLLVSAGLITAVPLILFVAGTQRLSLSTIGLLQYVSPSLQFLVAVMVFGEPLGMANLVSFWFIWGGLLFLVVLRMRSPSGNAAASLGKESLQPLRPMSRPEGA